MKCLILLLFSPAVIVTVIAGIVVTIGKLKILNVQISVYLVIEEYTRELITCLIYSYPVSFTPH